MKAIPLEELVRNYEADIKLLDTLILVAAGLQTTAREGVQRGLLQEIGQATIHLRHWEAKAEELDYPAAARA